MRCNHCEMLAINGINCHETGCPAAWREPQECKECGQTFEPDFRGQTTGPCCSGQENDTDGNTLYRCGNCEHEAHEQEFWPSDGNPAPHVCPECGHTDCFPV